MKIQEPSFTLGREDLWNYDEAQPNGYHFGILPKPTMFGLRRGNTCLPEAIRALFEGKGNVEIAARLPISHGTVAKIRRAVIQFSQKTKICPCLNPFHHDPDCKLQNVGRANQVRVEDILRGLEDIVYPREIYTTISAPIEESYRPHMRGKIKVAAQLIRAGKTYDEIMATSGVGSSSTICLLRKRVIMHGPILGCVCGHRASHHGRCNARKTPEEIEQHSELLNRIRSLRTFAPLPRDPARLEEAFTGKTRTKAVKAAHLFRDGHSGREIERIVKLGHGTIAKVRSLILESLPDCKCGLPHGHHGFCRGQNPRKYWKNVELRTIP